MIDFYVTYIHLLRSSYALLLPSSYVDFIESFIIFYVKLVFDLVPLVKWYSIAIADRRTCCLAAAPISDHCDVAWFLHISAPSYIHSTFFQRTSPAFCACCLKRPLRNTYVHLYVKGFCHCYFTQPQSPLGKV